MTAHHKPTGLFLEPPSSRSPLKEPVTGTSPLYYETIWYNVFSRSIYLRDPYLLHDVVCLGIIPSLEVLTNRA